ncbi:MAG: septum formation initiator family protein [Acidobacteriota bacterium]
MSERDETPEDRREQPERPAVDAFRSMLRAAVVLLLILLAIAGLKSYRDLSTVRAQEAELQRSILETQTQIRALTERVERIHEDPAMLEQLAREELGWVRPRDLVIVLPDSPQAAVEAADAER